MSLVDLSNYFPIYHTRNSPTAFALSICCNDTRRQRMSESVNRGSVNESIDCLWKWTICKTNAQLKSFCTSNEWFNWRHDDVASQSFSIKLKKFIDLRLMPFLAFCAHPADWAAIFIFIETFRSEKIKSQSQCSQFNSMADGKHSKNSNNSGRKEMSENALIQFRCSNETTLNGARCKSSTQFINCIRRRIQLSVNEWREEERIRFSLPFIFLSNGTFSLCRIVIGCA